jgi:hypothetical protein
VVNLLLVEEKLKSHVEEKLAHWPGNNLWPHMYRKDVLYSTPLVNYLVS